MPYFNVKEVLSVATNIIDEYGFDSSKTSSNPTWKRVANYVYNNTRLSTNDNHINHVHILVNDESTKIVEWVKSIPEKLCSRSAYMTTAKHIIDRGYCGKSFFGLIVKLVHIFRERNK